MFAVSPDGVVRGDVVSGGVAQSHSLERRLQAVVYGRVKGHSLLLDAYLPPSDVPTGAVLIVHGGGWVRGDRNTDVQPLFAPLERAGLAWFSIDYRLAKSVLQFGVAIDDVKTAIRFIKSHAGEYNINPERLTLLGESAGGQLAAMAVLTGSQDVRVQSFIGLYMPSDLVTLMKEAYIPSDLRRTVIGTPWEKLVVSQVAKLSPLHNLASHFPETLLIHGTADPLVPLSQSALLCEAIRQAGGHCELYEVPGAGHGIRWWDNTAYLTKLVSWIKRY